MARSRYHARRKSTFAPEKEDMFEAERKRKHQANIERIMSKPSSERTPYERDLLKEDDERRANLIKQYSNKQAKDTFKLTGKLK